MCNILLLNNTLIIFLVIVYVQNNQTLFSLILLFRNIVQAKFKIFKNVKELSQYKIAQLENLI
jgi:hypothetical protein